MIRDDVLRLLGFMTLLFVITAAPAQIIYYNPAREERRAEKEKARNERAKCIYDALRYLDNTMERAGYPQQIRKHAAPSDTGAYVGYYVGGGVRSSRHGHGPGVQDGTWGWDYAGCRFQRCIQLLWSNNNRYQGGTGSYRTDGPRPYEELKEKKAEEREMRHGHAEHGEVEHGHVEHTESPDH